MNTAFSRIKKNILLTIICAVSASYIGCYHNNQLSFQNKSVFYNTIEKYNNSLKNFRASGRLIFKDNITSKQTARVILAGERSGKFRFDIMSMTGMLMNTIAFNGKNLFLISYYPYKYIKKKISENFLNYIINLNLTTKDLLLLLNGGIPIKKNMTQQIIFANNEAISKIEILSKDRTVNCTILFDKPKKLTGENIPDQIKICTDNELIFDFFIHDREINIKLDQTMFSPKKYK